MRTASRIAAILGEPERQCKPRPSRRLCVPRLPRAHDFQTLRRRTRPRIWGAWGKQHRLREGLHPPKTAPDTKAPGVVDSDISKKPSTIARCSSSSSIPHAVCLRRSASSASLVPTSAYALPHGSQRCNSPDSSARDQAGGLGGLPNVSLHDPARPDGRTTSRTGRRWAYIPLCAAVRQTT
jgi:hypothetical protein